MNRIATLAYGGLCYAFGMAVILYSIAFVGGFAPGGVTVVGRLMAGFPAAGRTGSLRSTKFFTSTVTLSFVVPSF